MQFVVCRRSCGTLAMAVAQQATRIVREPSRQTRPATAVARQPRPMNLETAVDLNIRKQRQLRMKRISSQSSIRITLPVTRLGDGPPIQVLRSLFSLWTPVDFNCFFQGLSGPRRGIK